MTELSAQVIIPHTHNISSLETDEKGRLAVTDDSGHRFLLLKYSLEKLAYASAYSNSEASGHRIENGRLVKFSGKTFSYLQLTIEPQAFVDMGDYLMMSSSEDIYVWNHSELRKLYIPQLSFPKDVVQMETSGAFVAMRTATNSLFVYDTLHQLIKHISDPAEVMTFDKWGCLWYSYKNRLYHSNDFLNDLPPVFAALKIVDASGKEIERPYNITDKANNYRLTFSANYAPLMDDISYAIRKEKEDWQPLGKNTSVRLQDLSAGDHRYWLRANGLEGAHAVSDPIDIRVEGTDVARYISWLLGLLIGLLALAILGRIRLRGELSALEQGKEKIEMQLAIASEKQKLGQAQMNPHFIFNVLNSISGLIALQQPRLARSALKTFSTMMRRVLDTSLSESITIGHEVTFLNGYMKLEAMIRQDSFDYKITNGADDQIRVPPMIVQPFVENAIIHGVHGLDRKGLILINIEDNNKYVQVTIEDNGRGRKVTSRMKKDGHNSAAIDIVQQRLRSLDKWGENHLTYEDLTNDSGEPTGTNVVLRLPKMK